MCCFRNGSCIWPKVQVCAPLQLGSTFAVTSPAHSICPPFARGCPERENQMYTFCSQRCRTAMAQREKIRCTKNVHGKHSRIESVSPALSALLWLALLHIMPLSRFSNSKYWPACFTSRLCHWPFDIGAMTPGQPLSMCGARCNPKVKSKVWYEWNDRMPAQDAVWTIDQKIQQDIHTWMGTWSVPGAVNKIKDGGSSCS